VIDRGGLIFEFTKANSQKEFGDLFLRKKAWGDKLLLALVEK
jgi:hypothetical protein